MEKSWITQSCSVPFLSHKETLGTPALLRSSRAPKKLWKGFKLSLFLFWLTFFLETELIWQFNYSAGLVSNSLPYDLPFVVYFAFSATCQFRFYSCQDSIYLLLVLGQETGERNHACYKRATLYPRDITGDEKSE